MVAILLLVKVCIFSMGFQAGYDGGGDISCFHKSICSLRLLHNSHEM